MELFELVIDLFPLRKELTSGEERVDFRGNIVKCGTSAAEVDVVHLPQVFNRGRKREGINGNVPGHHMGYPVEHPSVSGLLGEGSGQGGKIGGNVPASLPKQNSLPFFFFLRTRLIGSRVSVARSKSSNMCWRK